jgi:hypothetical protein
MGVLKEMLKGWAYDGRIVVTKKDVAAYASSDAARYFWIDKLEGQGILVPRKNSRVRLWDVNWEAVPKWYPELEPIVNELLEEIRKREEQKARQEAQELAQKLAQAKPVKAEASA